MVDGTVWLDATIAMEEIVKQLWNAANERNKCRLVLVGEPFPRVVLPFGVCQTTAKQIVLVCKQVSGYTKGGGPEGYRNLAINRIKEVEILLEKFQKPTDFDPLSEQYKEWVFHI